MHTAGQVCRADSSVPVGDETKTAVRSQGRRAATSVAALKGGFATKAACDEPRPRGRQPVRGGAYASAPVG